jgi:hypothetical protein
LHKTEHDTTQSRKGKQEFLLFVKTSGSFSVQTPEESLPFLKVLCQHHIKEFQLLSFCVTVTKCLTQTAEKEKLLICAHDFRGDSPSWEGRGGADQFTS